MMKRYFLAATPIAAMLLLTGCMDDNYDLSNIDTTSEVKVNGLVLPVNVKPVTLSIDEEGGITEEVDPATGKKIYAYTYDGDFSSDPLSIDPFRVTAPVLTPEQIHVELTSAINTRAAIDEIHYTIREMKTDFDYVLDDIDPAVSKVERLKTPKVVFRTHIQFPNVVTANSDKIVVKDMKVAFPVGMAASSNLGTYNASTGIVTINDYQLPATGALDLVVTATSLEIGKDVVDGSFTYEESITIMDGGELLLTPSASGNLPDDFMLDADYTLSSFDVTAFSGAIEKPLDGMSIDPISLSDLPDFLTGDGTNIILSNPQLSLSLTNPASPYKVQAHTGLSFTPVRGNVKSDAIELPGGLTVGDNLPAGSRYNYALSPAGSSLVPVAQYADAEKIAYPGLGNVLAGNGLPDKLEVEFANPNAFGQQVTDFPLGTDIAGVKGDYLFRAPLALEEGSTIYYSGTKDDWDADDLKDLYVTELVITATASSDVPLALTVGAKILNSKNQEEGICTPAVLPALAKDQEITFTIKAAEGTEINDIAALHYTATCVTNDEGAGEALSPDQEVTLNNVRAKVTGRYLYVDDDND